MQPTITLPLLWKISTNEIYANSHWAKRKQHKDNYLQAYLCQFKRLGLNFQGKIDISICFKFKKNALDADNCSYMCKLLIDCIKEAGIIIDDTPKYVGWVSMMSEKGDDTIEILLRATSGV
jgi:Holliday junction resolvase RusA-like endonuclease